MLDIMSDQEIVMDRMPVCEYIVLMEYTFYPLYSIKHFVFVVVSVEIMFAHFLPEVAITTDSCNIIWFLEADLARTWDTGGFPV